MNFLSLNENTTNDFFYKVFFQTKKYQVVITSSETLYNQNGYY